MGYLDLDDLLPDDIEALHPGRILPGRLHHDACTVAERHDAPSSPLKSTSKKHVSVTVGPDQRAFIPRQSPDAIVAPAGHLS